MIDPDTTRTIFISHISEEFEAALLLKSHLQSVLPGDFDVFVASDGTSIAGGLPWFEYIRQSVKRCSLVLVLLSRESLRREWLLFEAGIGDGIGVPIIPLLLGDLDLADVPFPLAGFQGRRFEDLDRLFSDISTQFRLNTSPPDLARFARELALVQSRLPSAGIRLRPFLKDWVLQFELGNNGNSDVELIEVEAAVPIDVVNQAQPWTSSMTEILSRRSETRDGQTFQILRLGTRSPTRPNTGVEPLPEVFSPSMHPRILKLFWFAIKQHLSSEASTDYLETKICMKKRPAKIERILISKLLPGLLSAS